MICILMRKGGINLAIFAKNKNKMKKTITVVAIVMVSLVNAQAYKGKGDIKAQVGVNIQDHGTGINLSADFGLGENMSYGFVASYLLSAKQTINIFKINRQKVTLPSINGIFSGFSGACFASTPPISKHDRTILWTSSVEDTKNAIDDGSVLGSFLGTYDLDNHQIKSIIIENPVTDEIFMGKVEGVCVVDWSNDLSPKHVIAVTDADGGCSEMLFIEIS